MQLKANKMELSPPLITIDTAHDTIRQSKIKDEASLNAFFDHILPTQAPGYAGPMIYRYKRNIPPEVLASLYKKFKSTFENFRCQPPGLATHDRTDQSPMAIDNAGQGVEQYQCHCPHCGGGAPNTGSCGRSCSAFRVAFFRIRDLEQTDYIGGNHIRLQTGFAPGPSSRRETSRLEISRLANNDLQFDYGEAKNVYFQFSALEVLVVFQDGQWHFFEYGGRTASSEIQHTSSVYLITDFKDMCIQWRLMIEEGKRFISMTNIEVLSEDVEESIDRRLPRKLFKTAAIWEFLREIHRKQYAGIEKLFVTQAKQAKGNADAQDIRGVLAELDRIGKEIEERLIDETRTLIERTHNIMSIDEAYRSREQNASIKRLSWITFIFLPLLFVATLYGMNVDLLKDNPAWTTYFYIAVPLFACVILSVLLLKVAHALQLLKFLKGTLCRVHDKIGRWVKRAHEEGNADIEMGRRHLESDTFELLRVAFINDWERTLDINLKSLGDFKEKLKFLEAVGSSLLLDAARTGNHEGTTAVMWRAIAQECPRKYVHACCRLAYRTLELCIEGGNARVMGAIIKHATAMETFNIDTLDRTKDDTLELSYKDRTLLEEACRTGDPECVRLLLEFNAKVDVHPTKRGGRTVLQAASEGRHIKVIEVLLEHGAEVNADYEGRTALQAACGAGHIDVVKLLLTHNAAVNADPGKHAGRTALQAACGAGHIDVVKLLLTHNAAVNAGPGEHAGRTALQAASEGRHIKVIELLLEHGAEVNAHPGDYEGRTALQAACGAGHIDVVKLLLTHNAAVNAGPGKHAGRTALQAASEGGHTKVVELLLEHGAEVNADPGDYEGRTALQAASGAGHIDVVQLLLRHNAAVNADPAAYEGRTALQASCSGAHIKIVELLLQHGAEVNALPADYKGRTALQAASDGGHIELVELLLEHNAGVNADPGFGGLTALQAAAEGGHIEVVKLLLKHDCKVNASPNPIKRRTALKIARTKGHMDVAALLVAHGARE